MSSTTKLYNVPWNIFGRYAILLEKDRVGIFMEKSK